MARGDEDGQLVQLLGKRGLEAGRRAELLPQVADLGAAQEHIEGTVGTRPGAREQMPEHRLLRGRHLVVAEWLEPVAAQADASRIRALRGWGLGDGGAG